MEREDTELEDEITLAGNALLSPPSSVSQLLLLLEKLENCLNENGSISFQFTAKGSRPCNESTYGQRTFESFGCRCESFCCFVLQSEFKINSTNFLT
ncbi:hypothetical protein OIU76_026943 [Salix suchowensis]|nr:hypothetical protein OIU76_026943 [Salix suchowensis]